MKIFKWIGIIAFIVVGALLGYWIWSLVKPKKSDVPGENNELIGDASKAMNWGGWIGAILVAVYFVIKQINTVNYVLYQGGVRVYDGITRRNRLAKRLTEHRRSGKQFDSCRSSGPSFRFIAREIERVRIRRFGPAYNIQHNVRQ